MSEVTYESQDTSLNAIEDYLGENTSLEDLAEMSEEERIAFFEQLYSKAELSEDDIKAFEDDLDTELDDYYAQLYTYKKELDAIIDSGNMTVAEVANIELLMEELDEWLELCKGDEDLMDNFDDALGEYNEKNVELAAGDSYTLNPDDPQNGDVYTIDATATEDSSGGSYFDAEDTTGLVDKNGDGVLSADEVWDYDFDTDGDGDITEADDPNHDAGSNSNTVTLELEEGDTLAMANYEDTDPPITTFKITKEDGTVCYVKIIGEPKIISKTVPTNLDSMPLDVTSRMFETSDAPRPYSYATDGYDPALDGDFYTIIDMKDKTNNTDSIEPLADDFAQGRDYTINFEDDVADTLDLDFDDDVELDFKEGDNGALIITATNAAEESVTITINNWYCIWRGGTGDAKNTVDKVNITGGIITEADYDDLSFGWTDSTTSAIYGTFYATNLIFHNNEEESLQESGIYGNT